MALLVLFAGLGTICALLWYCAVYALPVFAGFWAGWWALNHGAGLGGVVVGLIAGVALWLAGRISVTRGNPLLRLVGLALFVIPAASAGFWIVYDLAGGTTLGWRDFLATFCAIAVGGVTGVHLVELKE